MIEIIQGLVVVHRRSPSINVCDAFSFFTSMLTEQSAVTASKTGVQYAHVRYIKRARNNHLILYTQGTHKRALTIIIERMKMKGDRSSAKPNPEAHPLKSIK